MNNSFFYSTKTFTDLEYLKNWSNDTLYINYVQTFEDLTEFSNKIILVDIHEANYKIDITKKLILQKNYLIFCNLYEPIFYYVLTDLLKDLPKDFPFAVIGNTDDTCVGPTLNLNIYYFFACTFPNILRSENLLEKIHNGKTKKFTFSFLNGQTRPHRKYLWHRLNSKKLLDNAIWTWLDDSNALPSLNDDTNGTIPRQALSKEFELDDIEVDNNVINTYDWKAYKYFRQNSNIHKNVDSIVPDIFDNSYFSVVSETRVDCKPFITEKLFKPLLEGHPFIVFGALGYYKQLHKLGFKTFDSIIDESFDSEPDIQKRGDMIVQQIFNVCNSDLVQFQLETKHICEYNRNHYINSQWSEWIKTHHRVLDFFSQVVDDYKNYL